MHNTWIHACITQSPIMHGPGSSDRAASGSGRGYGRVNTAWTVIVLRIEAMPIWFQMRPKSARLTWISPSSHVSPSALETVASKDTGRVWPRTVRLGPRHVAALEQLRGGPISVSELASRLGLTLPTVSGVLADLDRAGFVERHPDPADRRRTIVQIPRAQAARIGEWLDGAAKPLAHVLDQLTPAEQEAFLKAMDLLETELHSQDNQR
jgi:DNA-binding MarR family transcriptional regulator